MLRKTVFIIVASLIISPMAHAMPDQQTKSIGMHHMVIKPAPVAPAAPTSPTTAPAAPAPTPDTTEQPTSPKYTPLAPKEALVKPEDFKTWSHMDEAASAYSKTSVDKLVYLVESERGAVPPQGLFMVAKALSDQKQMDKAALYFFVGQLRLTFDIARFPPRANEDDIQRLKEDAKKTEDQAAPNRDTEPRIENPHAGVTAFANSISHPILAWAMKDPKRLETVMTKVREWDASAPYAYDTGYAVNEPIPFEKWEKLLPKMREDYFTRMHSLITALGKI